MRHPTIYSLVRERWQLKFRDVFQRRMRLRQAEMPSTQLQTVGSLRALARHTDKHHIENGWAAFHASRLGMESANHLWAVLRYVKKCILPKAQLGWCEDCTAAKYDSTNSAETIMAATHCVRGQGCEWKAC